MIVSNHGKKKVLDAIRQVIELPDHIKSLTLEMSTDELVTVECTYYPKLLLEHKPEGPPNEAIQEAGFPDTRGLGETLRQFGKKLREATK